ncbi:hypothetical protein F5X99DRAFT_408512 [Biscogniauxia marginata]|nr:hypothetical protein F5X99DRAFT_408512 [Biscogniauxia marginata]
MSSTLTLSPSPSSTTSPLATSPEETWETFHEFLNSERFRPGVPGSDSKLDSHSDSASVSTPDSSPALDFDNELVHSDSSTLVYSQEPFSTFQDRALELLRKTIWPGTNPEDITVERLRGGDTIALLGSRDGLTVNSTFTFNACCEFLGLNECSDSAPTQSVLEILTSLIQARKADRMAKYGDNIIDRIYMDQLCTMASELDVDGWLSDVPISLAHRDFGPHNILVNVDTDKQLPIISAVLDWDSAVLVPMFLACTPPIWLWGWKIDEEEDERTANDIPPTPEARELKQIFEDAAGPDYIRFAYRPEYRLARQLCTFALDGMASNERLREAGDMFTEWKQIRQSQS